MADKTLDCKNLSCPMPIVKVSKAIKEINVGQTLEVISTDPAFKPDITAWANKTGHSLMGISEGGGEFKATIKRTT